jgi:uncharacterized protein YcaQ
MSIYRTEDWPFFNKIRKRMEDSKKHTLIRRGQEEVLSYVKQILEELKNRGPLGSNDIDLGKCKATRWGHHKIAGAALDCLFSIGKIGVYKKECTKNI